jgi:hypothetical protein
MISCMIGHLAWSDPIPADPIPMDNYVQVGNFALECLRLLKENKPTV